MLKVEKLFNNTRSGGKYTNDGVGKTSRTEGRSRAIKME